MSAVSIEGGEFNIDAALIAADLCLDPATILEGIRRGKITSLCERGIDADAGHYRLTFFHAQRRLRLVVDKDGTIVHRSVEDRGRIRNR
jgi:hypothetical protein